MATGVFERKHFMPGIQILTKVVIDINKYFTNTCFTLKVQN